MPELPEVQALAADLQRRLVGRCVVRLDIVAVAALKSYDPPLEAIRGRTVASVGRHGKFLDIAFSDDGGGEPELHLVIHLARAGWIRWRQGPPGAKARPGNGPIAARLSLDDDDSALEKPGLAGSGFDVTEAGTKKSLAIWLVRQPTDVPGVARLGPDPLSPEFTEAVLARLLAGAGRAQLKGVLRNQSIIAGIGNAYSDEILHAAKMSPFKPADLTPDEVARLYAALRSTLEDALAREQGVGAADLKGEKKSGLQVHGRNGQPCPVCGDTVRQVIYTDSTFQYCPTCQTGGKPLADRVLSRLLK